MDPDGPTGRGVIGDPQIDALIEQNLTAGIESLLPHTRVVAIATSPFVEVDRLNGRSPDSPAPESDPDRMDRLNEIIVEVASRYPEVAVVDLAAWVDDLPDDRRHAPRRRPLRRRGRRDVRRAAVGDAGPAGADRRRRPARRADTAPRPGARGRAQRPAPRRSPA